MTVRVRFAPSPTGHLHIGGARTCLYNALFAKATGGTLILRVEDTDLERSSREFEKVQREDLAWLGLEFNEGPEIAGECGPYRQSERQNIYDEVANSLIKKGHAFFCFCKEEDLEKKKEAALSMNLNPAYDGTCYTVSESEARARMEKGEEAVIRFKAPKKSYLLKDHVRGEVTFPEGMVGDFVLVRSNKMPTYNYCCVVDDWKMKITHVIRGEDHLNNTLRQLMIYEAIGATPPQFAHASLLIGKDRQKLSKRHGATSVAQYREEGYLPESLNNYLCLLGWSHPDEKDVFTMEEIVPLFNIDRFSKASPIYDIEKLTHINNQHMRLLTEEELGKRYRHFTKNNKMFLDATTDWQYRFLNLFKEKAGTMADFDKYGADILEVALEENEESLPILALPSTKELAHFFHGKLSEMNLAMDSYITESQVTTWLDEAKTNKGIKGKPLFLGARLALTGKAHGPDLKIVSGLTPTAILMNRVNNLLTRLGNS